MGFALAILAFLSLPACTKSRADGPADAYAAFSKAVQRGDSTAAYAVLSQQTQKKLAAKAKEISASSGGAIKDDPAALAFFGAARPDPLTEIKVVGQTDDRAVLSVAAGGRADQVTMVREPDGWKVDLSDQINNSDATTTKP